MFIRLYKSLKKMLSYMETKNVSLEETKSGRRGKDGRKSKTKEAADDGNNTSQQEKSLTEMLDLPHVDLLIRQLEEKVRTSKTINKVPALLPQLGRTVTSFNMNMENSSQMSPNRSEHQQDPMAVTSFNKRSRSVAPSELSVSKKSTSIASKSPTYMGRLNQNLTPMRRNSSISGKFFFTATGKQSSLGRDGSQNSLPTMSIKKALRDRYDKAPKLSAQNGHQKSQAELPH